MITSVKGKVVDLYFKGHRVVVTMTANGPVLTHNHASLKETGVYPPRVKAKKLGR